MFRDEDTQIQVCRNVDVKLRSLNVRIARFVIVYTNILRIKIPSDITTFSQSLSGPEMRPSLDDRFGAIASDRYGHPRYMEVNETPTLSRGYGQV